MYKTHIIISIQAESVCILHPVFQSFCSGGLWKVPHKAP